MKSCCRALGLLLLLCGNGCSRQPAEQLEAANVAPIADDIAPSKVVEGKPRSTIEGLTDFPGDVVFSPDGKILAAASGKTIKLLDMATGEEKATFRGHTETVTQVAYSPDGKTLASASWDETVKLWDVATGKEEATLRGHNDAVLCVAFSPDGKTVASGNLDATAPATIRLWDVAAGRERAVLEGHFGSIRAVCFSINGKNLASASNDNTVRVWDLTTGKETFTVKGHANDVDCLAYSPDGKTLASGSWDNTVKLWDAASGQEKATLEGHTDIVMAVAFRPDGKVLASGCTDRTIKLWDASNGKEIATIPQRLAPLCLAFSPDGKTLASGYLDKTINLLDIATAKRAVPASTVPAKPTEIAGTNGAAEPPPSIPAATDAPIPPAKPVETTTNSLGMKFVLIPAGKFTMGSPSSESVDGEEHQAHESPPHRVWITRPFLLGMTEVTQGQWQAVMETAPWRGQQRVQEGADYPATYVSWDDAMEFCQKLELKDSFKEGTTYRLPTEAEWEYACRAGTTTPFEFGAEASSLGAFAWYDQNTIDVGEKFAHRVARKRPNGFGVYDLYGNVFEWCSDGYHKDFYAASPVDDPRASGSAGPSRVLRGGSWWADLVSCRSASRFDMDRSYRNNGIGFRVVRAR